MVTGICRLNRLTSRHYHSHVICCLLTSFQKYLSGTLPQCQPVFIQIGTDSLSALIWVQVIDRQARKELLTSVLYRWPGGRDGSRMSYIGPVSYLLYFKIFTCNTAWYDQSDDLTFHEPELLMLSMYVAAPIETAPRKSHIVVAQSERVGLLRVASSVRSYTFLRPPPPLPFRCFKEGSWCIRMKHACECLNVLELRRSQRFYMYMSHQHFFSPNI